MFRSKHAAFSTSTKDSVITNDAVESKPVSSGDPLIIEARKKNIAQSPWKMNFLVKLIRGAWLPDALAQLKFSPKHRAVDVGRIVQRASSIARTFHELIPEELMIHEVFVTKGFQQKRQRIMGRGRTGVGYKRRTHVTVKVAKVDFEGKIANATTKGEKARWEKRQATVKRLKFSGLK
jgi:large subunit ribosomal protein L22